MREEAVQLHYTMKPKTFQQIRRDTTDVYEVTGTGKNRRQQIKIHYKFVGYLELPSIVGQHNYCEETRKGIAVEYIPNALQDNSCSYIQRGAKRQKEIECPSPTLRLVMNTRYVLGT